MQCPTCQNKLIYLGFDTKVKHFRCDNLRCGSVTTDLLEKEILYFNLFFIHREQKYCLLYNATDKKISLNIRVKSELEFTNYYNQIMIIKIDKIFYSNSLKEDSIKMFYKLVNLTLFS